MTCWICTGRAETQFLGHLTHHSGILVALFRWMPSIFLAAMTVRRALDLEIAAGRRLYQVRVFNITKSNE